MSASLSVAVIGAGSMGGNHARVVAEEAQTTLAVIVDVDRARADKLANQMGCRAASSLDAALNADACIVAAPTEEHVAITLALLDAQVPVLVEKPLAGDFDGVRALIAAAERADVPLMCGFVERFNPAVTTAMGLVSDAPLHMLALRHSPPAPRVTTSVVHDLLIHDVDLALRFAGETELAGVFGVTLKPLAAEADEIADCSLRFVDGALATLSASRASQRKVRFFNLQTLTALIEVDLLRQDVTVYRHVRHEAVLERGAAYRAETIVDIPFVRHAGEPLALQLRHFVDLIEGRADVGAERKSVLAPHDVIARLLEA
jgi:predicted dehydrogenase